MRKFLYRLWYGEEEHIPVAHELANRAMAFRHIRNEYDRKTDELLAALDRELAGSPKNGTVGSH